jgi:phage-related protein
MAAHEPVCGRANILDVVDKGEIYLTFVFDGIDSTQIGVVSVSDGSTYDTPILPTFTDNSLEVDGYDGRYYFNTRITQKDFTYNCFIDNLSAFQFDQLKSWIRPKKIGKLIRPEEPYRYYWVKVSSVDNLGNIPLTHPDTGGVSYTGNFSVTFTTIGQSCGYGMFYYQDDLKYYEYRDIFDGTQDYYYDTGLLYKEEMLPLHVTRTAGTWDPQIYNPGTYRSKIRLQITPSADIASGVITLTNETIGDVGIVNLNNLKKGDNLVIDWGNNTYTLNDNVDYTENVHGDIMYLQPRNYVEKLDNASIANDGNVTSISFDPSVRQVRSDDIGKTIMFKTENDPTVTTGAGGRIQSINREGNAFILEPGAGLWTNGNASVIITLLDDLKSEINIPEGVSLDVQWQIEPRYL